MARKVGRPKKAKREALGEFVRVRLRTDELRRIEDAIIKSNRPRADWLRGALLDAANKQ